MASERKRDIAPVFAAFGAAVFEGQHLENGLHLLLTLVDHQLAAKGTIRARVGLDTPQAHKKLGELFDEVQMFEYLTDAERKIIKKGLKTRNFLVHSYWRREQLNMATPIGRKSIIQELNRLREECRKAGRLVDSFIDHHLAKAGTSLDKLSRPAWEQWESDESVH